MSILRVAPQNAKMPQPQDCSLKVAFPYSPGEQLVLAAIEHGGLEVVQHVASGPKGLKNGV